MVQIEAGTESGKGHRIKQKASTGKLTSEERSKKGYSPFPISSAVKWVTTQEKAEVLTNIFDLVFNDNLSSHTFSVGRQQDVGWGRKVHEHLRNLNVH